MVLVLFKRAWASVVVHHHSRHALWNYCANKCTGHHSRNVCLATTSTNTYFVSPRSLVFHSSSLDTRNTIGAVRLAFLLSWLPSSTPQFIARRWVATISRDKIHILFFRFKRSFVSNVFVLRLGLLFLFNKPLLPLPILKIKKVENEKKVQTSKVFILRFMSTHT